VCAALEKAGAEFIYKNNGDAGVRLKSAKARKKKGMTRRLVRGPGRRKKSAPRNFSLLWG
jgi:hypothetical protein